LGFNREYFVSGEKLVSDADGPYYGVVNETVQFNGFAIGGFCPYHWEWDFGDTHTSGEQNPTHTYTNPGNYNVTLTVTDNGSNTAIDTTYAWIQDSNTPPIQPSIEGPPSGKAGTSYPYTFKATDLEGSIIWYYIDWDDGFNTGWIGPFNSGETITRSHKWDSQGTYTIKAQAKDPYNDESPWGELEVTMPRDKVIDTPFLNWLQNHPNMFPLLQLLLQRLGLQ
jgi:PKD repeat protein